MNEKIDNSCLTREWTWRDRLRSKLFPFVICHVPEAPSHYQDCLVSRSRSIVCFMDRLRILVTGRVEVETRIVTEHTVGGHVTNSVLRAGRLS